MLSVFEHDPWQGRRGPSRRELLCVGGLSALGLSLSDLARLRAMAGPQGPAARHKINSCVFIFLFGGPSHIDLWDMKPHAPAEIRGEFTPVATRVPGIHLCEHLPRLSEQMDKLCLLRSMTHHMPVHGPACSEMYTGREFFGPPITDQARPEDWPSLASLVARYLPAVDGLPRSIVLPCYSQFDGQSKRIAGQTGGRMGEQYNPLLIEGDPSRQDFEVQGLKQSAGVAGDRIRGRRELLGVIEGHNRAVVEGPPGETFAGHRAKAFELLERPEVAAAFDLQREPPEKREEYGFTKFGQSLLLARRLVEAGGALVTVNWDENKFNKNSPFWDTHDDNFPRLKNLLCPIFDRAFPTFLADLHDRGLLETTLVVAAGEFGRTPKVGQFVQNSGTQKTGRDHWPHAFTVLLAGGGVRGGQVFGATTPTGGYIADQPVSPSDLTATILYHLGVDFEQQYLDEFQRMPQRVCEGIPIGNLG
jgi:hypothetical protein